MPDTFLNADDDDTLKGDPTVNTDLTTVRSRDSIPRRRSSVASLDALVKANGEGLVSEYGQEQERLRKRVIQECTKWRQSHYGSDPAQAQAWFTKYVESLAETTGPWDYDVKTGLLYKPRPNDPNMTPTNILHQLGEYLSEFHDDMPTREQAVKDTEASGTKYSILARALWLADEDRATEQDRTREAARKKDKKDSRERIRQEAREQASGGSRQA